ncbi:hypothetical protein [Roseivivax isoporae]|uniref:Uncharacterized protein n=1 Tax=Roseivivax isoporae LMG 25204 TaxID=1449351 RepID=X7FG68_9RHOB|nr:hypothetical protein [Roseivivax isoporae]ETX31026.1 hypothetical protein RISW2_01090 [Roseivivax isoporae LMG 25204]
MTQTSLRRLQITCFLLVHVPLIAVVAFALASGVGRHLDVVIVAFAATLAAAAGVWKLQGRALAGAAQKST